VFSDFYVAALRNFSFTICGSHIEQVWPPLLSMFPPTFYNAARKNKRVRWITILLSRSY